MIRPLAWPHDLPDLERLDTSTFDPDWAELPSADYCCVLVLDDRVVGVGALLHETWNNRSLLTHLYVDAPHRLQGFGTSLVSQLIEYATSAGTRCIRVETPNVNAAAIRFYTRCGFVDCGYDASMYDPAVVPGEFAVFLQRVL